MQKHLLRMLFMAAMIVVPWVTQAQTLGEYTYSTGVDTTKWIDMSGATQILTPSNSDGLASSLQSIGFSFPFAEDSYTQYSVNTDGNLRLGSTVTGTTYYTTPFSASNANYNNPKINAFACDGYGVSGSHYVKALNTVNAYDDSLLCVEFCTGTYNSTTRNELYKWQVHLYTNGDIEIVYGAAPAAAPNVARQPGLGVNSTDGWTIDASHVATPYTAGVSSTTVALGNWPTQGRFYRFERPIITCPRPTSLTASNITATTFDIQWTDTTDATAWLMSIATSGSAATVTEVYTTSYSFTGLTPNTHYMVAVAGICGNGDTSNWRPLDIRTACSYITTLPYFNDFEDEPYYLSGITTYAEAFPNCWTRINDASGTYNYYPYINTSSTYLIHGSKSMYWYHSTSTTYADNEYAVLPPIDLDVFDMSDLTLSFYAKTTATASPWPLFIVGVMSDVTNASSFVPVDTITLTSTATMYVVSFANYTGTGNYIAIRCPRPTSARYCSLDDVYLTDEWCDVPTNVTASSTTDEVTVSWNTNGGSSFTVVLGTDTVSNVTDSSYTFTGLTSNTAYAYSVATECSSNYSSFIGGSIRTLCVFIDSLPYSHDFESDPYYSSVAYAEAFPYCWTRINDATSTYNYYPYVTSTSTYVHSGGKGMYWYHTTTTTYANNQFAVLPGIDTTVYNISDLYLSFYAKTTSTSYHPQPIVGVMTNPNDASTFTPVYTFTATEVTTSWELFSISFADYTGYGNFIAIKWPRPSSACYLAIDDIYLTDEWCDIPTNVTASATADEVTVSWNTNGGTSFTVILGNDTIPGVFDSTYTFYGLTPNTVYNYSVATECSNGLSTFIVGSIRTACVFLDSLPYSYGFEDLATGSSSVRPEIPCWHHINNGTSYFGYPYVSSTTPHSGSRNLYWYASTTTGTYGDYEIVVLPGIDTNIYPINTLQLTFWARPSSTSYSPVFYVGVMTDPSDASTFQTVATINVQNVTTWQEFTTAFGNFTGTGNYIAVRLNRPSSAWYAYTDDFTLEEMPNCPSVNSVLAQTTASAARLTWTYDAAFGTPTGYDVNYRYADDPAGTPINITTTDAELVLTGLDADTSYWVSVEALCSEGSSTPFVTTFSTQALPCIDWDTTGGGFGGPVDTIVVGTPGTSTTNVMPVNQSYNYSYCQHLILSSHLNSTGPQNISGIGFDYAYSSPMTHATNCSIYMANTTRADMMGTDSTFVPYSQLQLVYVGPLNCTTSGWNYFQFNQGVFQYDGVHNICVAIVDNSGSSDGSSYVFRYETLSGTAMTHRVYGSTPYGPTEMDAARAGQSYWRSNMRFTTGGGGDCIAWATCLAPSVSIRPDANGDLELTWLPGYQETTWDVDYRRADTSGWTNVLTGTTSTSYTFMMTDLLPNTQYLFRVTANCGDTIMSATASYTTPCSYISIPYYYGFEDMATGSTTVRPQIPCWHHLNNGSSYYGYPYVSSTTPHSGSRNLYWYLTTTTGTYGDYEVVVLPPVNTTTNPINTLQLTFWARPTGTSYAPVFYVGVMTDPTDISTFQYVDTIAIDHATTNWMPYESVLSNYTGTGQYVALRANRPSSAWYAYTDDFALENAPNCPRVTDIEAHNITITDATIDWTATTADEYEVEYGTSGFSHGTGTLLSYISDDSVTITGLVANTAYDVYVRGICSGDTGNWSFTYTFRTACGPIDSLPFFEDFEAQATTSSTTGMPFIPCWALLNNGTSYGNYPYLSASTTYNHTPGGGKGLYWYGSTTTGTYSDYMYLILPQIDTTELPINTLQLVFWAKASSTSYTPVFQVGVMQSPTDTAFQSIQTITIPGITEWTEYTVGFGGFTGHGQYVAIRAMRPSSAWYAYVDDIKLEALPACARVEDLQTTYAALDTLIIAWTDTSSTTAWFVEYDTVNFTPGGGIVTPIRVTDTFYTMAGLDSGMTYHIYVYPDCGSTIAERYLMATTLAASPSTVPYFCDFENAGVNGWDLYTTGQTNYWMVGNATGNTGRSLYVTNNGSANSYTNTNISYSYAVRTFHLSDSGEYAYSFDWKCGGEGNYDFIRALFVPASMNVEAGELPFGTSSYNFGQTVAPAPWIDLTGRTSTPYGLNLQTTWQNRTGVVRVSTPGNYKLIFAWTNDGSGGSTPPGAIDNVSLIRNTCPMPTNVTAAVTGDSIGLTWTPGGTESSWVVTLGSTSVIVTTPSYTFTGLTNNTDYTATIRSICGVGDTSLTYTETYHTPCSAASLPFSENFDSYTTSTTAATGVYVPCWDKIMTGTSTYQTGSYLPQIYYSSSYAHSGSYSYRLYGVGYHMLPPMSAPLDSLQLTFWDYTTSTSYGLEVGVMEGNTFVPLQVISTPASTHAQYTIYFGTYTGSSRIIAFRNYYTTSTSTYYSYHYLDNVEVDYIPTCPPVLAINSTGATTTSITVDWTDQGSPSAWQIEYGSVGHTLGAASATRQIVSSHPVTITGLTALTNYDFYVRPICSATDTGYWSDATTLMTAMCDNVVERYSYDSTMSSTTSSYAPMGYSFYNYGYVQTIIDSAQMAGLTDPITAFAFDPATTSQGDRYNHMDIYMANVSESNLSSGFIMPDTTNHVFVPVVTDGDFRYTTTGWQLHPFDTTFTWDGHSNVLFVVNRRHGSYASGASFNAHSTSSVKTRYLYTDGSAYNPTTVTGGTTLNVVGDLKFFACGAAGCRQPVITGTTHTYENATVTWTGEGSAYEVNIKETTASDFTNADIPVVGNSYTFYGLQPATSYTVRVRQDCNADSLGYSDWVLETVVTDSLPCLPPDSLTVTDMTNADATFDWVPFGYETMWEVHVWNTAGFDTTYTVTTHPVVLGGYTAGVTYNASVRPLCGTAHNIVGDWGDTVTFTAATCPDVTGLTASEVGASSLRLSWTANPAALSFVIEYGYTGFEQGTGTQATSSTPSYVVTGLQEETGYDFYVRAECGTDWYSENWAYVSATTEYSGVICDAPTGVSAVAAGNAATVSWTSGEGDISYELEYGPHGFAHGNGTTQSATASPVTISNLNYETQYDVYVRAFCEQNASSAWSVVTSFTTETQGSEDCDPVTNLTATEITENSAVISWTAGATGTEWEVVLTNASGATLSEARTNEQRYQLNGLTPGTSYIVKVRTVCGDDQYSDYVSTSFTTIAVGIDGVAEATCTIYPNPTSSATTISVSGVSGKVKIAVVDMNGRTVASEMLECSSDCTKTMDVERLAQGAYFVRITGENVNMVRKLIVR